MKTSQIPLLKLTNLKLGTFLNRPNRFSSEIKYKNEVFTAHIHDPGRLTELLIKDSNVLFTDSKGNLDYYIKAVQHNNEWVIIDTALHSKIALEVFKFLDDFADVSTIQKEVKVGKSRIDFLLNCAPLEVKGVTLVQGETALFPDAPTKRGAHHVQEIIDHNGMIMFLVFRKAHNFKPNLETDPIFTSKLSEARKRNIPIYVIQLDFDGETIFFKGRIPLADF